MAAYTNRRTPRHTASERLARDLRGFGPAGILSLAAVFLTGTLIIARIAIPVGALLVMLWVKLSHTPWPAIGFVRPQSWRKTLLAGVIFGIVFKLFSKSILMPLLGAGPVNLFYQHLAGNTSLLPFAAWTLLIAGVAEEIVFRGFAFERLFSLLGKGKRIKTVIVIITSLLFGLAHLPQQGFSGALHALSMGLVFGTVYAVAGRLFLLMVAHAAYNLTALALIYWQLERDVAQFFFR